MPVYQLIDEPVFPSPEAAEPEGLLAVGGDLSVPRLLLAYSMGIFPWYNAGEPTLWWSPDPRCILELDGLKISRSLAKTLRKGTYSVSFNRAFDEVLASCAETPRGGAAGTWITEEMRAAYGSLHRLGFAHSVECWQGEALVGGLYGICLGRCFFGESMFHRATDASKVALVALVGHLRQRDFELIDCQVPNDHLASLGAREIPRREFLSRLVQGGVFPGTEQAPVPFPETVSVAWEHVRDSC